MHNNKLGYYQVGQEQFTHKVPALIRGTETDTHPEWMFNREVFDQVSWKQEPSETLWELYRQRAQQLRDQYDYLILGYSGGSDSKNILDVFLHFGIKIDEIVTKYSARGMGSDYVPTRDELNYDKNAIAEWEFTAKADFEWLAKTHPEIKLTVQDWFDEPDLTLADDWYINRNFMFAPFIEQRRGLEKLDSVYQNKQVGYVMGIDKPRITLDNGRYYIHFIDVAAYGMSPDNTVVGNATIEYFYWAPEAEAILRKQAHTIKNHFVQHPEQHKYITWPPTPGIPRDVYEGIVRSLIYPTWETDRFQLNKSTDSLVSTDCAILESNAELKQKHQAGLETLRGMIDPKFHNKNSGNFVGMISPFYEL
jgi:hypothetical protein